MTFDERGAIITKITDVEAVNIIVSYFKGGESMNILENAGIKITESLTSEEIKRIEEVYGITFPWELQAFYAKGVPVGAIVSDKADFSGIDGFYNWHDFSDENVAYIKEKMEAAYDDKEVPKGVPRLIPIYGHQYVPMVEMEGLPVISVCGADVIFFAQNLLDFMERITKPFERYDPVAVEGIPFWSDYILR